MEVFNNIFPAIACLGSANDILRFSVLFDVDDDVQLLCKYFKAHKNGTLDNRKSMDSINMSQLLFKIIKFKDQVQ